MPSAAEGSTAARRAAYAAMTTALPDISVYPSWPSVANPPCVIVGLGAHDQASACLWEVDLNLTCVAPGGDNDGALTALEELTDRVTVVARDLYGRVDRDPPVQNVIGGTTHLTVLVRSTVPVTL